MARGRIYRRANGLWAIDYHANGQRVRQVVGSSKRLAEDVLNQRLAEVISGEHGLSRIQKVKFRDFVETDFNKLHASQKRSWHKGYQTNMKRLMPFFGDYYLSQINSLMVERYKVERQNQPTHKGTLPAKATINRELACLKLIFNKAISWDRATENPVKKVKFFKENNARVRFLNPDELSRLLSVSPPHLKTILTVAINTGMRKSEMRYLKWEDVNFGTGVITLHQTKNGEVRHIPINSTLRTALMAIQRHPNAVYVFSKKNNEPYDTRKSFETAVRKAEIADFRFHDLRHSFASYLVMQGIDLNTVRELLGHKNLEMTLRYSHLSADHKRNAVEQLCVQSDTKMAPKSPNPTPESPSSDISALTLAS